MTGLYRILTLGIKLQIASRTWELERRLKGRPCPKLSSPRTLPGSHVKVAVRTQCALSGLCNILHGTAAMRNAGLWNVSKLFGNNARSSHRHAALNMSVVSRGNAHDVFSNGATWQRGRSDCQKHGHYDELKKRTRSICKVDMEKIERVKWTNKIRNEAVLERVDEEKMMLKLIRKRG
ncbi:hypothetical protein ANN_14648 [Periplaneta americana]|uniref:Uncharacterized protein n=1 Tax=Periplaneta americana TaxID=6978 RepID=A0ABQ8SWY0_PERAM|nr:hypothetical protein ANN_14648 [Periplaneta americana]